MKASRPTIIEVRGSRLGLDIKGPRPRARPGSAAQMSEAGSREERTSRARPQPASAAARSGRTTLLSRPRSAERPVSASPANSRRPAPVPARADRPCTAAPRSVKTGPNSRRPRKPRDGAGCETVVKHIAGSSSSSGGGGDAVGRTGHSTGDQTSCGCSTSSLSRWTSSAEPGAPRRKGVTFSDTLSTDTAAAGSATAGAAGGPGATGASAAAAAAAAASAATSEDAAAGSDSSDTSPSEVARRRVAARPLPAAAATDELTRELLARGQQLRQGMARLIARQMDRSGGSLTPPDSELEARLAHMGVAWDTQTRAAGGADRPSVAAPSAAAAALRGLSGRPRTAFTLPSESSTSGPAGASVSTASAVPPLNLPPSLMSSRERAQRRPQASAVHSPRRHIKTANMTDRLPLLRKASFLRISIDSLSFDPVFVRSVSSAPDAADTRVYLEYELPLETGSTARRSTRLGGKRIATETPLSHRSVLPVRLTAAGVRLWQASELQLTALGQAGGRCWTLAVAALPLRQLLRQPRLTLSKRLALTLRAAGRPLVGHVRVRLELGSDRDDFPAALAAGEHGKRRRKLRRLQPTSGDSCSEDTIDEESEDGERSEEDAREDAREEDSRPVSQEDDRRVRTEPCLVSDAEKEPARLPAPTSERSGATEAGSKVRLVHWAVRVGGGTPSVPGALRNTYLVVRAPWLQQAATSVTCWAEERPQYDYTLISPVLLTAPLVSRLHNNLLVVEVWQRSQAPGQDRLVGLSRLPLERLYLTFSQPDVTDTVLQMKSPVLVHDGSVSVHHPATDTTPAQLELTLAAGTQQQVDAWMAPQRDRPTREKPSASASERVSCDCTMQLRLGRLLHVPDINEARSGEVDCFVQYTWPVQDDSGDLRLRSFSTEPAISRVNPPLSHEARHVYRAPSGGHVADALVAACAPDGGARWDVVVRTFYPVVRDRVIARGVLSSSQIFGLVEACGADGRQSRTFAVPLQLLAGGDDPAHPSLEVSLTVETAPVSVGSRTELSSSGGVGVGAGVEQLPTWTEVIAARSGRGRPTTTAAAAAGRTGAAADAFEADPQSELELRRPVREARETPVSRRHTWVCGDGGWQERPGRSPVPVTREEGSQTDLESQAAVSQEALSQAGDSSPVSQLAHNDSQPVESRTAPRRDSRRFESRPGGDSRPDGGTSSGSEELLDRRSGGERAEEVDSQPSSESEMLRRLRRPLGAPPAAERPPVVSAPATVPAAASVSVTSAGGSSASRTAADRADILSDIERDLERLRRTGSIFSGQRRAAGPVDDTTQTDDLPVHPTPVQAPARTPASVAGSVETAPAERDSGPAERGGGGDAARGRSWSPPPASVAAECRASEFADVSLLEAVDLSKGRGEQHVMHVSTEAAVERGRFLPPAAAAGVGRRDSPAVSTSDAATPATRAASSLENAPVSNGRAVTTSYHARDAHPRDAPSRDAPRDALSSLPSRATGRTGSLAEATSSSAGRPTSRADSWVSAVTPATRPVSPGPPSPSTAPRPPVSGGDGDGEGAFRAQLTVVEALHLPRIVRGEKREQPRVFVSVQTPAGAVSSPLETGTRPRWNWSQTVWIGRELLQQEFHYLVLKVWHRSASGRDRVLGLVLIDLVPLLHGLNELLGWYNIVDLAGVCRGQMKLSLRPLDDVPCVERESLDLSVSLDDPDRASYVTTSWHSAFPSHLTRYPELAIRAVNRAHHKRDTPLELSPRQNDGGPDQSCGGGGGGSGGGGGRNGGGSGGGSSGNGGGGGRASDAQLSEELLQRLLPAEDECELMDGTRSFLASVLRKNLEDLDSLRDGLLRRVEPDWTKILPMQTNHAVQNLCTSSTDRSGCSSRSGQVRSRSPHTAGGTGQGHAHGRRASEPDAKSSLRSRVDSRTYTSLTNGGHWDSGSAATSIADKENHQFSTNPPPRRPGDPGESYVYVRAMNDVSSGNYASEVFCHRREVRGGPTDGPQVTSAPVGRFFSEQETAELRRRGSGASGPDSRADGGGGGGGSGGGGERPSSGGGGGELPSSVVDLIETAVRRSAELCEPPPPASSDSDSLPFGDNLRSLNDTSEESDRGAPTSHAELFISILQEMEARDGPSAAVSSTAPGRAPDEGTVALGAILARDMSRLTATVTHPSSGGGGGSALEPAVERVERRAHETAAPETTAPDRGPDRGQSSSGGGGGGGGGGGADGPPETVGGGDCAPSPHLLTWRDDVSSDGRRSARRRRLAAALDMR